VLGALDDKIELNRRMNETLEALAQSLFKSWFVDATRSALPKGWREGSILEVGKLLSGGTPKPSEKIIGTETFSGRVPRTFRSVANLPADDGAHNHQERT